jgi:hypothetical protein
VIGSVGLAVTQRRTREFALETKNRFLEFLAFAGDEGFVGGRVDLTQSADQSLARRRIDRPALFGADFRTPQHGVA